MHARTSAHMFVQSDTAWCRTMLVLVLAAAATQVSQVGSQQAPAVATTIWQITDTHVNLAYPAGCGDCHNGDAGCHTYADYYCGSSPALYSSAASFMASSSSVSMFSFNYRIFLPTSFSHLLIKVARSDLSMYFLFTYPSCHAIVYKKRKHKKLPIVF